MKKMIALILALVLSAGFSASASAKISLALGTGGLAGIYHALGSSIADLWMSNIAGLDVSVQPTDASKDNIIFIQDGKIDLATVQNDAMAYAYEGSDFFGGKVYDNFYAIGTLYPEAVQCIVASDSGVRTISDLKGKNVSVGALGSGTYMNARQFLACAGLTMEDINAQYLSFAESAAAFQDGRIDAAFMTSGIPNASVAEISTRQDVFLLAPTPEEWEFLHENSSYYVPYIVPAGTYRTMTEETIVPAVMATLIVSKDMDADLVYDLTRILFEKRDDLTHFKKTALSAEEAISGVPTPFHPGAARYYSELGLEVTVGE